MMFGGDMGQESSNKIKKSDKVRLHNNLFCFDFFRSKTCPSSNLEDAVDNHLDLMFFRCFSPMSSQGTPK